jgi:hypothetical protein
MAPVVVSAKRPRPGDILGVITNTGLRLSIADSEKGVTLGDVGERNFTLVRKDDVAFDVISAVF